MIATVYRRVSEILQCMLHEGPATHKNPVQDCTIFEFGEDYRIVTKDCNLA